MKKLLALLLLLASPALAQSSAQQVTPGLLTSGTFGPTFVPASSVHPFPVTISGGISGGVYLGTSASVNNPQAVGDPTTGFNSLATGTVGASCSGVECITINSTGVGVGTSLPAYHVNTVNAITTTLTTGAAQGAAGWYLPFSSTNALSVGQIVGGNSSITVPTTIGYIANGTAPVTTTSSGAWSGNSLTVASATGVVPGMLMYDTTTPANIPSQCIVNQNSAGVIYTPCTVNTANNDTIVFYPTIALSQQTTANLASGTSITFTNAGTDVQVNGLTSLSNVTIGGQLNLFQSTNNPSSGLEIGPSNPLVTLDGLRFVNTYTPPGTNGGNLYVGIGAGPTGNPGGYGTTYQATNNTAFGMGSPMQSVTSGGSNACFGFSTCNSLTTGSENTVVGTIVGDSLTTGNYNTYLGFAFYGNNATGSNNTCIGGLTCSNNSYNYGYNYSYITAVGATAIQNITGSAANNTALGYDVGPTLTSGTGNILIGTSNATDVPAGGSSNEINIGGLLFWNKVSTSAPAVSACGTGSPAVDTHGNNRSGTLTAGAGTLTSCTITFAGGGYTTWNHCRLTFHNAVLAGAAYSYTLTAITVTATSLTSATFDYDCDGY